jgi:transcriptional regulator GlxA family with amidase domain
MAARQAPREIAILVFPGVQSLDLTGPLEVFAAAHTLIEAQGLPGPGYRVRVVSADGQLLLSSSGLQITPHASFKSSLGSLDTLVVAGGLGSRKARTDQATVEWLLRASKRARRTASVCTGAFLLASAGLLDGRRATTHWASAEQLAREYPAVRVDPEPIFLRDDHVWTSAGVTAGMDLALALVEEDHDRDIALAIARHLVLFLRRPGSQAQFSATLATQEPSSEPLREVRRHIVEHPARDLSVHALAELAHMSPRHFARSFRSEIGETPARYVERVRIEAARRALEDSSEPIAAVANACGFGSAETMRRAFLRALDVGPVEYRRRFLPARTPAVTTVAAA